MTATKTAGTWKPKDWPVYFAASSIDRLRAAENVLQHMLVAVNEMADKRGRKHVEQFIKAGRSVLLDSGVYWLSTQHAEKHNMTMNEALSLAPDKVSGFDSLFTLYVDIVSHLGPKSWGYIEIDQGGRENKIKTRAKLESMGLRPIPVYHPLNDGWDYFDYLAERYDRICFGNVVMADTTMRKRLIATAWERRRKYPNLWIHALGMTPSEITTAFPINSCDSSTWISGIRWASHKTLIANRTPSDLGQEFIYDLEAEGSAPRGHIKAVRMCGYDATIVRRTMLNMMTDQAQELGADPGMFIR